MSIKCGVPGCRSKSENPRNSATFYTTRVPEGTAADPQAGRRRFHWIKAVFGATFAERYPNPFDIIVCSKHFVSGQPAKDADSGNVDWAPSLKLPRISDPESYKDPIVAKIIKSLPEVRTKFDTPEYILFDEMTQSEVAIEKHLVEKYLTTPTCDENGYYNNDHDYLGLPLAPVKTEMYKNCPKRDHNYSLSRPACYYFDSRHFCNICSYTCDNLFRFNQHITAHTVRNHVTCKLCQSTYLTSTCLNNHLTTHTTLCDQCGNEVPTVQLKAHQLVNFKQKYKHPDSKRYKVTEKNKIHFCVKCMMGSNNSKKFGKHLCFKKLEMLRRLKML